MPAPDVGTPAAPVPRPHLGHLRRLTDDTGMIQHALGPVPNRATGYTSDDNARALLVCLEAIRAGIDLATAEAVTGAEQIAREWDISREQMEEYAYQSHRRAVAAIDGGLFAKEIAPLEGVTDDEGPRRDTSLEKMAALEPLTEGGRLTAAVSSQISDGTAALLIASERAVRDHGLTPRARIHHISARGEDPIRMLSAPIPATAHALEKTGMTIDRIDAVEINEAFASVVLAWLKEIGADPAKVNPNGGAIALGHPLGATGGILMTKLLHELERTGGRYGLQTMCEGGGMANATIIERL
ncbi:MAG: acetyl-CoA C-acyltransferase [Symbiobacteriaceae bacterium]